MDDEENDGNPEAQQDLMQQHPDASSSAEYNEHLVHLISQSHSINTDHVKLGKIRARNKCIIILSYIYPVQSRL